MKKNILISIMVFGVIYISIMSFKVVIISYKNIVKTNQVKSDKVIVKKASTISLTFDDCYENIELNLVDAKKDDTSKTSKIENKVQNRKVKKVETKTISNKKTSSKPKPKKVVKKLSKPVVKSTPKNTWKNENGSTYYYNSDGNKAIGLQVIDSNTYYFNNDGTMHTGWLKEDKQQRYFNDKGIMQIGLQKLDNNTYYFNKDGTMHTGWLKEKNNQKYFDNKGIMQTGFLKVNNKTYYFEKNGNIATGTKTIKGIKYNFDKNGALQNKTTSKNNTNPSKRKKLTGWQTLDGKKAYFNSNGKLIKKGAKKIIDVSYWQGNIDWKKVKKEGNVDGAIIRIGYTTTKTKVQNIDSYFEKNLQGVTKNNIPYGFYYYGYAKTQKEAKKEADLVLKTLKKYKAKPTYPIFYDAEEKSITKSQYEIAITTFNETLKKAGYKVGVYGNYSALTYSYLNSNKIKKYNIWVAQWHSVCNYKGKYMMWQYTSSGKIPGINGRVDISVL